MMKKLYLSFVFAFSVAFFSYSQSPDSLTKKLVPIDSLLSKVRPDTSQFSVPDSLKVDTVYIDNPMNGVKVGVDFASAYTFASITYERVIHFMGSFQVRLEYVGKYNPLANASYIKDAYDNTVSISGIGIVPELRYYGTEKYAPKGLFFGFYLPFRVASVEVPSTILKSGATYTIDDNKFNYTLLGAGFDLGYQYLIKNKFSIEALAGVSVCKSTFVDKKYSKTYIIDGFEFTEEIPLKDGFIGSSFYPRVELNFGYLF